MLRLVSLLIAIFALFGAFGTTALAGAGGPICGSGFTTLTPHSRFYYGACDQSHVALLDYTKSGELQVARIVNTAKVGLTPRYNTLRVSLDNQQGGSRLVWEMGFSFNFISITAVPGYLMTIVDFGTGNEGFLIWDTRDPNHPVPLTGTTYQSSLPSIPYSEVAAYSIDYDGEIYNLLVAVNRSDRFGLIVSELFEYRLGPIGHLVSGRHWLSLNQIDDFSLTYGGNLEVALHDQSGKFHVAYLSTENFDRFELIGVH